MGGAPTVDYYRLILDPYPGFFDFWQYKISLNSGKLCRDNENPFAESMYL